MKCTRCGNETDVEAIELLGADYSMVICDDCRKVPGAIVIAHQDDVFKFALRIHGFVSNPETVRQNKQKFEEAVQRCGAGRKRHADHIHFVIDRSPTPGAWFKCFSGWRENALRHYCVYEDDIVFGSGWAYDVFPASDEVAFALMNANFQQSIN